MKFVSPPDLEKAILSELDGASEVRIAVAFFSKVPKLENVLQEVPKVQIMVSGDWGFVDPYALRAVSHARILEIPKGYKGGRFHAKVITGKRSNGTRFAFIGSANISLSAMQRNYELVCQFRDPEDGQHIDAIIKFQDLWEKKSINIDWNRAEQLWLNRERRRFTIPSSRMNSQTVKYWILKTTAGIGGRDYWQEFFNEGVVAIGWEKIDADPSSDSEETVLKAIKETYPNASPEKTCKKLITFGQQMDVGDRVIIMRGYKYPQKASVHIYGIATIESKCVVDRQSHWWSFKRRSVIELVEAPVPVNKLRNWLRMDSCLEAIHKISWPKYDAVTEGIEQELGIELKQRKIHTLNLNDTGGVWEKANPWMKTQSEQFEAIVLPSGISIMFTALNKKLGQWMTRPKPLQIAKTNEHQGNLSSQNNCKLLIQIKS